MKKIVAKFGGSSLADANQIRKVKEILFANDDRKYCVVSASGKRNKDDDKITDLLISLYNYRDDEDKQKKVFESIKSRYIDIVSNLKITYDIESELDKILLESKNKNTKDYLASRGEYLSAKILSLFFDGIFLDMSGLIIFDDNNKVDYELSFKNIKSAIENIEAKSPDKKIIIPGFYGSNSANEIVTFSRGGSDITGAIVARAVEATLYENWTDVSGVMFEDPRVVKDPPNIEYITYTELRELSYMGANVLHEETVYPVSKVGIPINILNTNVPNDKGTMIMSSIPSIVKRRVVTGIAGKKGFTSILLQKTLMNEEVGFVARLLKIFEKEKISVEHCPTGIDTISIIVRTELLKAKENIILDEIKKEMKPDVLNVEDGLSIIAIVGEGMVYHKEITYEIFKCLHEENIGVKMIDLGSSGINVIIGVNDSDYEKTLMALKNLSSIKV
ncbi:MAG: aspartate kinase [Lachnospiraceae bacterium]|nr:aspartate kinase [Lachnospiraceae bacterium]